MYAGRRWLTLSPDEDVEYRPYSLAGCSPPPGATVCIDGRLMTRRTCVDPSSAATVDSDTGLPSGGEGVVLDVCGPRRRTRV